MFLDMKADVSMYKGGPIFEKTNLRVVWLIDGVVFCSIGNLAYKCLLHKNSDGYLLHKV